MIQISTALITILILKSLKAMAAFKWHLSNLVAFIRLNLFVKINLYQWLDKPFEEVTESPHQNTTQGVFFENLPKSSFMKKILSIFLSSNRLGHYW
jgi:hypothetical protein